jgi:hypothetical protein
VWLIPLAEMTACLEQAGLQVRRQDECTQSHLTMVDSLINAFAADESTITARLGRRAFDELLAAHLLWSDWLREGRVRKFAMIAQKTQVAR